MFFVCLFLLLHVAQAKLLASLPRVSHHGKYRVMSSAPEIFYSYFENLRTNKSGKLKEEKESGPGNKGNTFVRRSFFQNFELWINDLLSSR